MASLSRRFIENPVARAELSHQGRAAFNLRWRRFPAIFGLGLAIGLISSLGLLIVPRLASQIGMRATDLTDLLHGWLSTVTVMMGALIMIHHLAFSMAALQLGSTTIAREKQARTWESLLLTGVDARRIVYGKWWATMTTLWQVYRPLLLLRFGVALWMGLSGSLQLTPFPLTPPLAEITLTGVVVAVFPLCYSGFTVTLGLLASLLSKSESTAYRVASAMQFASFALSLSLILVALLLPLNNVDPNLVALVPAVFVTPIDGGMLALIDAIANNGSTSFIYLMGLLICVLIYAGLTLVALRMARSIAVRQRALPPL